MPIIAATVSFEAASSLPEDVITNTFHFDGEFSPNWQNLDDILHDFYTAVPSGWNSISAYMPDSRVSGTVTYRYYDLADTPPRAPVHEETRTFTPSSTAALPAEVALCLSFQSTKVSGLAQARRRNRVYLGPFITSVNSAGRPSTGLIGSVAASARDMLAAANSAISWDWVTRSPTAGTTETVDNGWVDDAWDTQRRRGVQPTTRVLWTDSTP